MIAQEFNFQKKTKAVILSYYVCKLYIAIQLINSTDTYILQGYFFAKMINQNKPS